MYINTSMDKEDVIHKHTCVCAHTPTHNRILLSHKKDEIMPFVARKMNILREVNPRKTNII